MKRRQGKAAILILCGVCALVGFIYRQALPTIKNLREMRVSTIQISRQRSDIYGEVRNAADSPGDSNQKAGQLSDKLKKRFKNLYTGEPIREEDSPGNFTLKEDEKGRPIVCTYNDAGGLYEIKIYD